MEILSRRFFESWDKSQAPFAIIEGSAATFLVPICDKNNILTLPMATKKEVYRFKTLDEMLDWYASLCENSTMLIPVLTIMQKIHGIRISGRKFFIKANAHGAGQAYYTTDHSAYNGKKVLRHTWCGTGFLFMNLVMDMKVRSQHRKIHS